MIKEEKSKTSAIIKFSLLTGGFMMIGMGYAFPYIVVLEEGISMDLLQTILFSLGIVDIIFSLFFDEIFYIKGQEVNRYWTCLDNLKKFIKGALLVLVLSGVTYLFNALPQNLIYIVMFSSALLCLLGVSLFFLYTSNEKDFIR